MPSSCLQRRGLRACNLFSIFLFCVLNRSFSFAPYKLAFSRHIGAPLAANKGFGATGGGFGSSTSSITGKKTNKSAQKQVLKQLEKTYGGTSPQSIAQGTARRIEEFKQTLPPQMQLATALYQQLQQYHSRMSSLDILQQANLPKQEVDCARRAQDELERLYAQHDMTEVDVRNAFQKLTWDASADAKAARSVTRNMPSMIQERVEKACRIVADAVSNSSSKKGRCLDVGCGFGVLVPILMDCGLEPSQIHGVDLSEEMIRHARDMQPRGAVFEAADFLNEFQDADGFEGIIFCSSLHDIPDMSVALDKAVSLLNPGGKLVILHAQGATHVLQQAKANPILVKRGLPDAIELEEVSDDLELKVKPAGVGSTEESKEGYLAVLQKSLG